MRVLLFLWTTIRNAFEAVVWATLIWAPQSRFIPLNGFIYFGSFSCSLFFWTARSRDRAVAFPCNRPDVGRVGHPPVLRVCLIPAVITVVIANFIHMHPDWLHVFLFFACACDIPWRRIGKRKVIESWKVTRLGVDWKPSGH